MGLFLWIILVPLALVTLAGAGLALYLRYKLRKWIGFGSKRADVIEGELVEEDGGEPARESVGVVEENHTPPQAAKSHAVLPKWGEE